MTELEAYEFWESARKWGLEQGMSAAEAIIFAERTTKEVEKNERMD